MIITQSTTILILRAILRAISRFETVYLSRSTVRLNETIANSLSGSILTIARVVADELDSAQFKALLVRSVARNIVSAIDVLLGRMNILLCSDSPIANLCVQVSRDHMATL